MGSPNVSYSGSNTSCLSLSARLVRSKNARFPMTHRFLHGATHIWSLGVLGTHEQLVHTAKLTQANITTELGV